MIIDPFNNKFFMKQALVEAEKAFRLDEVPVGAIIVSNNKIISRAHNYMQTLNDATAHAEMQAITMASDFLGGKYLYDCTLYVTLEPCVMCAGASFWSKIPKIVFGARDEKNGFLSVAPNIFPSKIQIESGVLEYECRKLLLDFFAKKR
jgi:tRNA(adenine34) deaminase